MQKLTFVRHKPGPPKSAAYQRLKTAKGLQSVKVLVNSGPFVEICFEQKSHNAEKTERGTLWDFSTSVLSQNSEKIEGIPIGDFFVLK